MAGSSIKGHYLLEGDINARRNAMKKLLMLGVMMAMVLVAAVPAMAADRDRDDRRENRLENRLDRFFDDGFCFFFDCDFDDRDRFDDRDFFGFDGGEVDQEFDQEAESGDVDQSFDVSSTGDNSNQCVGIQGVANTGNAQNQIGVTQIGSDADDFEFDDVDSTIEVSPENSTECDQQVNQAATASG